MTPQIAACCLNGTLDEAMVREIVAIRAGDLS